MYEDEPRRCQVCGGKINEADKFCGACGQIAGSPSADKEPVRSLTPLAPDDPESVGPYRLAARIGIGGMGTVYLAYDEDEHPVAVKIVKSELSQQEEFRKRFAREVRAMQSVMSPYTVELVAANGDEDPQWIAMEYVAGLNVAERVAQVGPFTPAAVREFAASLAKGIGAIHAADLVHRDLKPSNVMVTDGGLKILDFGIARELDATSLTTSGQVVGSIGWLAPEQVQGTSAGTKATDIHAWGALVYYAATGKSPYGVGRSDVIAWRILNTTPDTSGLPIELADLRATIDQALAQAPQQRPSVGSLLASIGRFGVLDQTRAGAPSDMDTAVLAEAAPSQTRQPVGPESGSQTGWWAGRKLGVVAGAVAAGLILGTSGYALARSTKPGSTESSGTTANPTSSATVTSGVPATPAAVQTRLLTYANDDPSYGSPLPYYLLEITGENVTAVNQHFEGSTCFVGFRTGNTIVELNVVGVFDGGSQALTTGIEKEDAERNNSWWELGPNQSTLTIHTSDPRIEGQVFDPVKAVDISVIRGAFEGQRTDPDKLMTACRGLAAKYRSSASFKNEYDR